jgi:hypothetical protein
MIKEIDEEREKRLIDWKMYLGARGSREGTPFKVWNFGWWTLAGCSTKMDINTRIVKENYLIRLYGLRSRLKDTPGDV